jgi:glutamyl-tRNA synthetase
LTDLNLEIRKFVLENAIKYDGTPDVKSVMSALLGARADLRSRAAEVKAIVEKTVTEVGRLSPDKQRDLLAEIAPETAGQVAVTKEGPKGLPDLPNLSSWPKVVMRMAPFPSGPLHIGNSRMVILNDYYVQRYNGKLILVYDDTIGSEEKVLEPDAYDLIREGLEYLGVKYHETIYKSDRLELFYRYAVDLINGAQAYVCTCDADIWRKQNKVKGKACACRDLGPEENLARWEKMLDGSFTEKAAAVRLKTGMDLPDPALRDHVILRISEAPHPRVGTKYRVWPLLEFSWGIDDHELGISHIIRGKDLVKEGRIEEFVWNIYGWQHPELLYYGKLRFEDATLSKSKSRKEVKSGAYSGWDDPRTWSMQSLAKRGIDPKALTKVMLDLGLSMVDISISMKAVYSENRKLKDADAPRLFYVDKPVWLALTRVPADIQEADAPMHPDFPDRGSRRIPLVRKGTKLIVAIDDADYERLEDGQLFRLKDLANFTARKGSTPAAVFQSREVDRAREVSAPIIHWIPKEGCVSVEMTWTDGSTTTGLAEPSVAGVAAGTFVQFERVGFTRIYEVSPSIRAAFAHK